MSKASDFFAGGGSGTPINALVPFNVDASLGAFESSGMTFLPTGWIETNPSIYPDATVTPSQYTGSFSIAGEGASPEDIVFALGHYWVINRTVKGLYKYTPEGVYTGTMFSLLNNPFSVAFDGTHFWIADANDIVSQYTSVGVLTGTTFSIAGETTLTYGLTWDGTFFYAYDEGLGLVFKYTSAGVYTGTSFPIGINQRGLDWDGTYFYTVSGTTSIGVRQLDTSFVDTGVNYPVFISTTNERGVAINGDTFAVGDITDKQVQLYSPAVGLSTALYEPQSSGSITTKGLPLCLRVK